MAIPARQSLALSAALSAAIPATQSPRRERLGDYSWSNQWRICLRGQNWSTNKPPRWNKRHQTNTLPLLMVNPYSLRHRLARVLPSDLKLPEQWFERPGQQEQSSLRSSRLLRLAPHLPLYPPFASDSASTLASVAACCCCCCGRARLVQLWMLLLLLVLLMHTYRHTSKYYTGEAQRAAWGSVVMIWWCCCRLLYRLHWH